MKTPVEKKLPGTPIPREELVAEWRELQHSNLLKGVLASFMFDVYYSTPDKTYQWRVQFDCGCVRDVLTRDRESMPADDRSALGELADSYHFGLGSPSEREKREQKKYYDKKAVEDARASFRGEEPVPDPRRPLVSGEERLPNGQFLCHSPDCTRYQQGGPVRDIVSWIRRRDNLYVSEPLVIDGKTIRGEKQQAVWDVLLSCDHFGHQTAEPDWDPKEGPRHHKGKKRRGLDDMLEVVAQGDPDKENYWRRMYAEDHPEPAPFVYCYTCPRIRSIVAYQRIGWLEPKPKPVKPKPPPRKTLERRLKKLEADAADLRERLKNLPDEAQC